jgi:hypothetical protein
MLTTTRFSPAAPEAAWHLLVDLAAWPRWGPTVAGADLDEPGPLRLGSTGRVWTPVGVPLPFRITEFTPGRSWGWAVAGVPATRHHVTPEGDGCRVGMDVPLWAPAYLPVCMIAVRRIAAMAATG